VLFISIFLLIVHQVNNKYAEILNPKKDDDKDPQIPEEEHVSITQTIYKVYEISIWVLNNPL